MNEPLRMAWSRYVGVAATLATWTPGGQNRMHAAERTQQAAVREQVRLIVLTVHRRESHLVDQKIGAQRGHWRPSHGPGAVTCVVLPRPDGVVLGRTVRRLHDLLRCCIKMGWC